MKSLPGVKRWTCRQLHRFKRELKLYHPLPFLDCRVRLLKAEPISSPPRRADEERESCRPESRCQSALSRSIFCRIRSGQQVVQTALSSENKLRTGERDALLAVNEDVENLRMMGKEDGKRFLDSEGVVCGVCKKVRLCNVNNHNIASNDALSLMPGLQ